jgi:protein-disulfide isomerase
MKLSILRLLPIAFLVSPAYAALSREDLKNELKKDPSIIMDVLRENKKDLLDIVQQAAQEEQGRRQKEEEENEKKAFEESFKNPLKPEISKDTRIRGNKDAKYTLVEYSDFQCPYCARGYQNVEQLRKKYGKDLRFVYKDMPLNFHPQAMPAAKWFEAISLQSQEKAWQFHDRMFQNQEKLGEEFFKSTAKELGVDVAKAEKDAASEKVAQKIESDVNEAKNFGFTGTPGFLLNGIPVRGAYPVEHFDSIIARLDGKK